MKIAKRDVGLLIILAGLVVFMLLYGFVFSRFQDRTDETQLRIDELRPIVKELEEHYLKLSIYEKSIDENRLHVLSAMQSLPADIKDEDTLSYLLKLESDNNFHIDSVTFQSPVLYSEFDATIQKEGEDVSTKVGVYRHTSVFTGLMSYETAKNVFDYIYATEKQTVIDSVSLTYNSETGGLSVSFTLSKFSLNWDGGVYVPEPIPSAIYGVSDPFGSVDPAEALS